MTQPLESSNIHPTAIVDPAAEINFTAVIGPYCVIEGPVKIGHETRLLPYCYVRGHTEIGAKNQIGPSACIGTDPQSLGKYSDETGVVIGDGNIIREFSQIHRSITDGHPTRIGDQNYLMAGGHVAHDTQMGSKCVLTNGAHIGGHCVLGDGVVISSPVGVHQFVRIGRLSIVSGLSACTMDVPPFMLVEGRNNVRGLNVVGMRRAGVGQKARAEIKQVYKAIYRSNKTAREAAKAIELEKLCPEAREVVEFCLVETKRGIMPHAPYSRK